MNNHRILFGANWKMHKTMKEAVDYIRRLLDLLQTARGIEQAQVFVLPPFTVIEAARRASAGKLWIGAQNMHWAHGGAYTGEISAPMLAELGVDLVELGHAERRRYFNETDAEINRKVHSALRHGLRPLICVGEQTEDKEFGAAREALSRQVRIALGGVEPQHASSLIIAYEPVWSIGAEAGSASPDYVRTICDYIRSILYELLGSEAAGQAPVIYGGDVNLGNAASLLIEGQVDGLFVGRAGRDAEAFSNLIRVGMRAMEPLL